VSDVHEECDACANGEATRLDRPTILSRLEVGDLFCARSAKAPVLICLVTQILKESVVTRRVTCGSVITFNRTTGLEETQQNPAEIISVEPLPPDVHALMLRIDRRTRLQVDRSQFRLDDAEKRALRMLEDHYYSHRL
jgi:hypothetical protein